MLVTAGHINEGVLFRAIRHWVFGHDGDSDLLGAMECRPALNKREIVTTVYQLLGIDFALHKLQSGQDLVILGIVCDLKFEPERREKLLAPMEDILSTMPQLRLLFNPFTAAPIEIVKRGSTRPTSFLLITRHLFQTTIPLKTLATCWDVPGKPQRSTI